MSVQEHYQEMADNAELREYHEGMENEPPPLMQCPFCDEDEFDRPGLKSHLLRDCPVFADIPVLERRFG